MRSIMKRRSRWLSWSFAVAILCAGCQIRPQTPVDVQTAVKQSYPAWSFIGLKSNPDKQCPGIDEKNWEVHELFEKPGQALGKAEAPLREAEESLTAGSRSKIAIPDPFGHTNRTLEQVRTDMKRFCLYRWIGAEGKARIPIGSIADLARLDADPMALATSAEPALARVLQPRLSDHFFREVGRTGISLPIDEKAPKVRLAFLDNFPTTPDGDGPPADVEESPPAVGCPSNHGDFLRLLGRAMTCEDQGCAAEIRSRLALAYRKFDPTSGFLSKRSTECGGYFGNLEDLAQAIREEVQDWQKANAQQEKPSPLVLNLSLGWDGRLFGGITQNGDNVPFCKLPAGQRAVYDALDEAHILGVLVFAATGNDRGGPVPLEGPLLPAAWERTTPGEAEACEGVQRDYPLVYAVGGLRSDDQPLANAQRPGAMPSLAAYGDHAALGASGPYWPTGTYTGTSVATAIVSSTAAVIWHANPTKSAEQVVKILRSTLPVSGLQAGFGFSPTGALAGPNSVWRVSLCSSLAMAGNSLGTCCAPQKPRPPQLSHLLNLPPGEAWPALTPREIPKCKGPNSTEPVNPAPDVDVYCPSDALLDIGSIPAAHPQPGNDPCPNCADPPRRALALLTPTTEHVLYLEIAPNWPEDRELLSATFETNTADHSSYFIKGPFLRGAAREVVLPGSIFPFNSDTKAMISWRVLIDGVSYSLRTPVFIAN
ncbi:MAG: S8/S53 family peptidase [Acidobacteriota bacterium]